MAVYIICGKLREYLRIRKLLKQQCFNLKTRVVRNPLEITECRDDDNPDIVLVSESIYRLRKAELMILRTCITHDVEILIEQSDGRFRVYDLLKEK